MPRDAAPPRGRIALVFSSLRAGGIERARLALAEGFLARGLAVDLVVLDGAGELRPLVPAGAGVIDLGSRHARRSLPPLVRYLRRARPTAVLSSQTHVNVVAIAARALAGVPARLIVSEHIALDVATEYATRRRERWFPRLARLSYHRADGIVAVSHGAADRFAQATGLSRERVTVIYNPIVTPALAADAGRPVTHPWFGERDRPVFLAAGRLVPQKDHRTLIDAFATLRARMPCRLVILGEGPERPALEALIRLRGIEDDVALPGFTLHPAAFMARADVFVLSSRWEGLANVLVEAMACGTPVVSTDCPSGPAELLDGGGLGSIVPVGDAAALAAAMEHAFQHPLAADVLRRRASEFSLDRSVDAYLAVLRP